jgi:ubiquitin-conjugating enzyme E2 variant
VRRKVLDLERGTRDSRFGAEMAKPIKQKDAHALEGGYSLGHRTYEIGGILLAVSLNTLLAIRMAKCPSLSGWWTPLAALVGLLFADFISGFVHWMFDTWGSVDTPVVGRLAIRTFRHHHVDAKAITRHDFIETNGHNITLTTVLGFSGLVFVIPMNPSAASLTDVFIAQCCLWGTLFVSFTSQIHKWAHMDEPRRFVQLLQRARLVLEPKHHDVHHTAPFARNYCITVGWLNGPLRAIRFFETLEWIITTITGALPRVDDIGEDAALEVIETQQVEDEDAAPAED